MLEYVHRIAEKVDEAIKTRHDQRQWDMYHDEMWNWSGMR